MRPAASFTLHAILAACLAALAASSAAAAPQQRSGQEVVYFTIRLESAPGAEGPQLEVQSFSWGPRQTTSADGSRTRSGNQIILDDNAGKERAAGRGLDSAAVDGQAAALAEKRQHKPVTIKAELDRTATTTHEPPPPRDGGLGSVSERGYVVPHVLERGSLTLWGNFPGCIAGNRYAGAQFSGGGMNYELKDVVVSACGGDSMALDYARVKYNNSPPNDAKVKVRAWDPKKKEE